MPVAILGTFHGSVGIEPRNITARLAIHRGHPLLSSLPIGLLNKWPAVIEPQILHPRGSLLLTNSLPGVGFSGRWKARFVLVLVLDSPVEQPAGDSP